MTVIDSDNRIFEPPFEVFRRGVELWREGRREDALEVLQALLDGRHGAMDTKLQRRVVTRALVFASSVSWPTTERLARGAIDAFPGDAFGWRRLGEALLRQDRYGDAEAALLKAVELDPVNEDSRLLLMLARRRLNPVVDSRRRPRTWPDRQHLFRDPRWLLERYLLRGYPDRAIVRPDTVFMTLGSCFAENLARHLAAGGRRVHSEPIGEEVNSTYANRFLLNWVDQGPVDGPTGVIDEIYGPQRRERLRQSLQSADVLVLTLGVAPCFFDRETGEFAFSALKSPTGFEYLQDRCQMRTTTVAENVANVQSILETAERIAGHAHQVVLTVSPVALGGTTEFYSAVVADCLSKSTLRLACEEIVRQDPRVIYWPSFEIVRWLGVHYTREDAPVFGAEDGSTRHVSDWLVDLIVQLFLERHAAQAQA